MKEIDFYISAKNGNGMIELIDGLKIAGLGENIYTERDIIVSSLRHVDCLKLAVKNLQKAKNTLESKLSAEFVASDIRAAENALRELIGEIAPDDILNDIFSKFCIGK
jgi:tRNA modification GTPase